MQSKLEKELLIQIRCFKLEQPEVEFKFHHSRKWRSDFAWPEKKILVEVEGGHYSNGRHVRGKGYSNDCEKYNEASLLGFTLIRVTSDHIKSGQAIEWISRAISSKCK